jgi:hypothetical protein
MNHSCRRRRRSSAWGHHRWPAARPHCHRSGALVVRGLELHMTESWLL